MKYPPSSSFFCIYLTREFKCRIMERGCHMMTSQICLAEVKCKWATHVFFTNLFKCQCLLDVVLSWSLDQMLSFSQFCPVQSMDWSRHAGSLVSVQRWYCLFINFKSHCPFPYFLLFIWILKCIIDYFFYCDIHVSHKGKGFVDRFNFPIFTNLIFFFCRHWFGPKWAPVSQSRSHHPWRAKTMLLSADWI